MRQVSGHDLARALERRGWVLLRVHGSHHIYGRAGSQIRISIPMHEDHDLKAGLLHHLMNLAELTEDDV